MEQRIRAVAPNPKKSGTEAHQMYQNYRPGMTVREYIASHRRARAALRWDVERGYVTVR